MAKMNKFKRLCADTNVLIGLALLYQRGQREFIDTNIAGRNSRPALKQYAEELKTLQKYIENTIRIPMREHLRSLNLSNSVAIAAYEAYRQFTN